MARSEELSSEVVEMESIEEREESEETEQTELLRGRWVDGWSVRSVVVGCGVCCMVC